ncbi:MAG TPA: glycerophosphodiester phosphodiesterase family protein [Intrasporangium sp.]|uniref:glycerophosphodiester phosphodiesterase family protein n=1 Tax=Intrasporangium sp. TaxID=1925024 RepID=UPI002D7963BB|nr:glycerophosphodiester phosphodiesterase family protein [Intrasporangium sp.]HET7399892.1 glycerophosphodiester phosphodiesterase family protein [Intrasporangium sp.]
MKRFLGSVPGTGRGPLVVAHRGASGYRPEHTVPAYELAARMGAHFIEPDLVATADGVLVVRHEPEISATTDVADRPEFADRWTTKVVDGESVSGWFTTDFTLAELRTLRARERLPLLRPRNTMWDRQFPIATFDEVLTLRARLSKELRRTIGVYPELKSPTFFRECGIDVARLAADALRRHRLNSEGAPVFVQCFEVSTLFELRHGLGVRAPLVLLTTDGSPYDLVAKGDRRSYTDLLTVPALEELAKTITGIGADKDQIIPRTPDGRLAPEPTSLVADAHAAGLVVHAWTFRAENAFLPANLRDGGPADYGRAVDEHLAFLGAGIDGLFTDHADIGVLAGQRFAAGARPRLATMG